VAFHDFNGSGLAVCLALRNGVGGLHGHRGRGQHKDAQSVSIAAAPAIDAWAKMTASNGCCAAACLMPLAIMVWKVFVSPASNAGHASAQITVVGVI
jgi:hypothetical protein